MSMATAFRDLTNLNSDGTTVEDLAAAPFPLLLLAGENDAVISPATVRRANDQRSGLTRYAMRTFLPVLSLPVCERLVTQEA